MSLKINVPYADNDKVKSLGAFWNPQDKSWTVPDHIKDINPFKAWIPFQTGCIVRKPYLLCISKTNCWKCKKEIPMIALGAENYFTFEYADVNDPENHEQLWIKASWPTLFSYISSLDNEVIAYLDRIYPFFKRTYSHTLKQSYYANTCTACGGLQATTKILEVHFFLIPLRLNRTISSLPRLNLPTIIILTRAMEVMPTMTYFTRDRTYLPDHQIVK